MNKQKKIVHLSDRLEVIRHLREGKVGGIRAAFLLDRIIDKLQRIYMVNKKSIDNKERN